MARSEGTLQQNNLSSDQHNNIILNREVLLKRSSLQQKFFKEKSLNNCKKDQRRSILLQRKKSEQLLQRNFDIQKIPRQSLNGEVLNIIEDVDWDSLRNIEHLADGAMCRVFSAEFNRNKCAVKTLLPDHPKPDDVNRALESELGILKKLNHPNCIALLGYGMEYYSNVFLVFEKMDATLAQILGTQYTSPKNKSQGKISFLKRVDWALQMAKAMAYLNDKAFPGAILLHRDLKPDNLGIGTDQRLRVMDFGLSIVVERSFRVLSDSYLMTGLVGSPRYMAPEVANREPYNEKADVHSFGMIVWEMLCSQVPFKNYGYDTYFKKVFQEKRRPPLKKKWSQELKSLLCKCWEPEVDARPSFREIVGHLQHISLEERKRMVRCSTVTSPVRLDEAFSPIKTLAKSLKNKSNDSTETKPKNTKDQNGRFRRRRNSSVCPDNLPGTRNLESFPVQENSAFSNEKPRRTSSICPEILEQRTQKNHTNESVPGGNSNPMKESEKTNTTYNQESLPEACNLLSYNRQTLGESKIQHKHEKICTKEKLQDEAKPTTLCPDEMPSHL